MAAERVDTHNRRFEEKDAEIFRVASTKTSLDTPRNYFFAGVARACEAHGDGPPR